MTRRDLLLASAAVPLVAAAPPLSGEKAFMKLKLGNRRHAESRPLRPHQNMMWRMSLTQAQHPFACVLTCADSRVPPEFLFDAGLGDLFVVRVAGNIVDDAVLGSLEYAVEHLHVGLIVVLGHERCGAVAATVEGGASHDHVASLLKAIQPAVEAARRQKGNLLENAIRENTLRSVRQLQNSRPVLSKAHDEHKLVISGGVYDLDTAKVQWLD
jgi:carbonic anhydrase